MEIIADNESFECSFRVVGRLDEGGIRQVPLQCFVVEGGRLNPHVADTSASCSEPRVITAPRWSTTEIQPLNILKQSRTTAELRPGSVRIVLRKFRVNRLTVLSDDIWSIHEMQRKSILVTWKSNVWSRIGDVPNT